MSSSNIEWTEKVWNPVVGCTPVSEGCRNCYAARMAMRLEAMGQRDYAPRQDDGKTIRLAQVKGDRPVFTGEVRTLPDRLNDPLSWRKPCRVFVNSMSDLFHKDVPFEFIDQVFAVMAMTPHITYQILTKRPERMAEYLAGADLDWDHSQGLRRRICNAAYTIAEKFDLPDDHPAVQWGHMLYDVFSQDEEDEEWPLPNVWLGTSIEDQKTADERIPHLLKCPAAVQWLSYEPALGPVDFSYWADLHAAEHAPGPWMGWIVMGGESGPGARPMHPEWARYTRAQCAVAGVPFFFKQWGAWAHDPDGQIAQSADCPYGEFHADGQWVESCLCEEGTALMACIGKKAAGRLLDGVLHDAYPVTGGEA